MQITDILVNVSKVIVGKEEVTKKVITSILAGGHILLEDVPGMGKTMLAKTLAKSIDCDFGRVQFTPDLLPSDITGIHIYNQKSEDFVLKKGPVFANIILADEINRATPRTQSALLECMEEHQVTIDGDTLQLDEPFIVIATENPIETAGTYPLPEAQLDRFLMKLEMGYPDKEEEITILNRFLKDNPIEDISNVCSKEDIKAMKNEVKNIYIHPSLIEYIVKLAEVTRNMGSVAIGISPRGSIAMVNAARAYAYVNGRNYVVPSDIKELALCVWGHRLVFNTGIVVKENREQAINEALSQVEVPTEEWSNR